MNYKPQKKFDVRTQIVRGKNLLIRQSTAYELDEVGLDIWELCDGTHTTEEIARQITEIYDIDYSQALSDCQEFIKDLTGKGLLQ